MNDFPRRSFRQRLWTSAAAFARLLEPTRSARLSPARVGVHARLAARGGAWLLLADGRPALQVRPRR